MKIKAISAKKKKSHIVFVSPARLMRKERAMNFRACSQVVLSVCVFNL